VAKKFPNQQLDYVMAEIINCKQLVYMFEDPVGNGIFNEGNWSKVN